MTRKVYKSAMGKEVDLGSLLLQNEHVRAVGNMNVNARGDVLDASNKIIDRKNRQAQRQYQRSLSNVSNNQVYSSSRAAKEAMAQSTVPESIKEIDEQEVLSGLEANTVAPEPVVAPEPLPENTFGPTGEGGLAAAIARSRLIKQEKEKTLREKAREQQIKKI